MKEQIEKKDLASYEEGYKKNKSNKVIERTITHNGLFNSAIDKATFDSLTDTFSVDVKAGSVTNQKQSGRCWMFAGLNVLRTILMKKLNIKNIELSQAYLQFYDKLEKSNATLERAMLLLDEPVDSRMNSWNLDNTSAGGYFNWFSNLVKKYGVVPSYVMPDGAVSSSTSELNSTLNKIIAKDVYALRKAHSEGKSLEDLRSLKEGFLSEIYKVLGLTLGTISESFTFEYVDKDEKYHNEGKFTPKEFYDKYIGGDFSNYLGLGHYPLPSFKEFQRYECKWIKNVAEGEAASWFSIPLNKLKEALIASLKDDTVVWFAADVRAECLRKEGLMAKDLIRVDELLGVDFPLTKGERLLYRTSTCCHAMTFTGVNLDEKGLPNKWKIENSWGKDNGKDGYYVSDDAWFDEYVYEIWVDKKYVDPEIVKKYEESKAEEIEPFNPVTIMMK